MTNGLMCFAADATPERSSSAIAVAWRRRDERLVVEICDQRPGVDWLVPRLAELVDLHNPLGLVIDSGGPAGTAVAPLEALCVDVVVPTAQEVAQAAGGFYDAVLGGQVAHQGDNRLDAAVAGAAQRQIGESWGWGRRSAKTDISPLVAVSLALWGYLKFEADAGAPTIVF